jgi:ribosome modulation factor
MIRRETLIDLAISFTIANLNYLTVWRELIFLDRAEHYFLPTLSPLHYLTAIASVLVLVLAIFLLFSLLQRRRGWIFDLLRAATIASGLVLPLNFLRIQSGVYVSDLLSPAVLLPLASLLAVLAGLTLWRPRAITTAVGVLLLVLSPFALMTLAQAGYYAVRLSAAVAETAHAIAPASRPANSQRVIWITFDGFDHELTFGERPDWLKLPALDALRMQSFYALDARQATRPTLRAMPSMWIGRKVVEGRQLDGSRLLLRLEGEDTLTALQDRDHLFRLARDRGYRIGIAGWYHPYCRLFRGLYDSCTNRRSDTSLPEIDQNLWDAVIEQISAPAPFAKRRFYIKNYTYLLEQAKRLAADPGLDLVVIHSSVPHPPRIYDPESETFQYKGGWNERLYLDNVPLVDRFVRELRAAMEDAMIWERTTLLVSADTSWDGISGRVPFVLKLPHQSEAYRYKSTFSMLLLRDLLIDILDGRITSPEEAAALLDRRAPG